MYDSRDRNTEKVLSVPKGCESLSERVQLTLWVGSQLKRLEREKSTLLVSSLRQELTERLNASDFQTYESLVINASASLSRIASLEKDLMQKQSELDSRPIREIVKYASQETLSQGLIIRSPSVSEFSIWKGWIITIVILIIIAIFYHNSHS
jgi:hypothetical protein